MIEVTEENIGSYTIDDVIFPIIGSKVKMPANEEMHKIITDLMKEDNITMSLFEDHATLSVPSATGSYRKIIGRAQDIKFDIVECQNTNEDLLTPNYLEEPDPTPEISGDGEVTKALRLKFSLKPSSYATMFLREVTKTSSAFSTQAKISQKQNA